MKIDKKKPHLFIRINNYDNYDYILEHKKVIERNGFTWILKIGKTINKDFIESLVKEKTGIIIKSSKKLGNKFYYCKVEDVDPHNKKLIYPDYYEDYFWYEGYNLEDLVDNGYWFKITTMTEIPKNIVDKFVIIKSQKPLYDCATETRVVHMYIENNSAIEI